MSFLPVFSFQYWFSTIDISDDLSYDIPFFTKGWFKVLYQSCLHSQVLLVCDMAYFSDITI